MECWLVCSAMVLSQIFMNPFQLADFCTSPCSATTDAMSLTHVVVAILWIAVLFHGILQVLPGLSGERVWMPSEVLRRPVWKATPSQFAFRYLNTQICPLSLSSHLLQFAHEAQLLKLFWMGTHTLKHRKNNKAQSSAGRTTGFFLGGGCLV